MPQKTTTKKTVELVFPSREIYREYGLEKVLPAADAEFVALGMDTLLKSLKGFRVRQIELNFSAVIETGNILRFIVNAKAEGGVKITLAPE